jgi:S1-C subfamily serine protease
LLTLDGRWTDSVADLFQAAASIPPGTPVKAIIRRGNKERGVSIKPVAGF